jgi:lipid II:glycine glycyltransferase (peptidoglycan interpeptide bridge formation enzyme)
MNRFLKNLTEAPLSVCKTAVSFLQSDFWGNFKASFAWIPYPFIADWGDYGRTPLLVLYRPLAAGIGFAYTPWGPELPGGFPEGGEERTLAMLEISEAARYFLPCRAAFTRFDPPWASAKNEERPSILKPFTRAAADIQAPDTVLIDLTAPLDGILARMKPKWRYNIRLGERKTRVFRADEGGLDTFYELLTETAGRDGIAVHGAGYYRRLFNVAARETGVDARLYLAEAAGRPLAGIITLFRGKMATYLYGASSGLNRNLMATYALQWQAMRDAKEERCDNYDLFGIPPDASAHHPMAGLYLFKTGFGGRIIHRPGSWDYAYSRFFTGAFHAAEKLRKNLRSARRTHQ